MDVYEDWNFWENVRTTYDIPNDLKMIEGYDSEWKDIACYPDYEVSVYGEVYSKRKQEVLIPQTNIHGYRFVTLYNENGPKMHTVHRLVANAFIPNPENKPQVNHEDGIKSNNRVTNLIWATNGENEKHAFEHGLKHPSGQKKVRIIETGEVFDSLHECARQLGGNFKAISNCIRGKSKTHLGYHYEVVDND